MRTSEDSVASSPSLLILASVINIRRGVKTIRLTDFVKLPRGGELLVIETYQQGPRSDSKQPGLQEL